MTTLNTIIEEGKKEFDKKFPELLSNSPSVTEEYAPPLATNTFNSEKQAVKAFLTAAMQRAYEVGANNERASWLRSEVEKLESAEMVKSNIITRYKEELKVLENGK